MRYLAPLVALLLLVACGSERPAPAAPSPTASPAELPAVEPTPTATPTPDAAPSPDPPAPSMAQLRGVWVHLFDDTLKSIAGIERMLDDVARANLNTVIVEVVRRQDSYYASSVLPRTPDPALPPGLDVLAEVTSRAHARGLAVHAWFPAMPTYHQQYDGLPRPAGWVREAHGPDAPESERWVTRSSDGRWGEYLDPGHPAVQDHLVAIAAELAARHPIDAVHLDYVRYDGPEWGYHPAALARFMAETGRGDVPAPTDAQWSDWRRAQTRQIVARVRDVVQQVNPAAGVSAAVIAWGEGPHGNRGFSATRAYAETLQDWPGWVRDGLVDAVFPMAYFRDAQDGAWFDQWNAFLGALAAESDVVVAPGVAGYLNPLPAGERQVTAALAATDGVVLYSYQQSVDTQPHDALLKGLPQRVFPEPAPPPRLR